MAYEARYINRTALTNNRILSFGKNRVLLSWKNYRQNGKRALLDLDVNEFVRRFLNHILPKGFPRVRYYGQLANRNKRAFFEESWQLLGLVRPPSPVLPEDMAGWFRFVTGRSIGACCKCRQGQMVVIEEIPPRGESRYLTTNLRPGRSSLRGPPRCRINSPQN